jgi:hypothetical protein
VRTGADFFTDAISHWFLADFTISFTFEEFFGIFWRNSGIVRLLGYPEKTDRHGAAAAAGKTQPAAFFIGFYLRVETFPYTQASQTPGCPLTVFSLSSRRAPRHFIGTNATDRPPDY